MEGREEESVLLAEWFDEHGEFLARLAYRYEQDAGAVEALLHDTFVEAADLVKRFHAHASPRTWLAGLLKKKAIEKLAGCEVRRSSMGNSRDPLGQDVADDVRPSSMKPADRASEGVSPPDTSHAKLFEDLNILPELHRRVLLLREVGDLDLTEMSTLLSISIDELRRILLEGRLKLQDCLVQRVRSR
jgi:RNA polymerase sigma factor (sigma-70 family)